MSDLPPNASASSVLVADFAFVSHRGGVRPANEDAAGFAGWVLTAREGRVLQLRMPVTGSLDLLVADGLGGHRGGERASRAAVQGYFDSGLDPVEAVLAADLAVHELAAAEPGLAGMGTTIVGARVFADGRLSIVNVGDSRAYRLVDGYLGVLSEDDRPTNGEASVVTQVLGGERRVAIEPHLFETNLRPGGVVMLCSDGLHDYVTDEAIAAALVLSPAAAAERLLDLALDAGGPDNVTIAVLTVLA
jgi:protein phosphatase